MQISSFDGSVTFVAGRVHAGMDKPAFLASVLGAESERSFVNGSLETYRFFPEPGIVATTDFKDDRLLHVSVSIEMPGDSQSGQSAKNELARKEKHDTWLREHLGDPPYRYNWGEVVSAFYQQHCESDIMVIYKQDHAGT